MSVSPRNSSGERVSKSTVAPGLATSFSVVRTDGLRARLKGHWLGGNGPVQHLAPLLLPTVEEQVHDVNVGAAQVFEDPGGHCGVSAVEVDRRAPG